MPELPVRRRDVELVVDDAQGVLDDGVVAGLTPRRTSSRKLVSTTRRWSIVGPRRRSCTSCPVRRSVRRDAEVVGLVESGPLVVRVHACTLRCHASAVASQRAAVAPSPVRDEGGAGHDAAISAAIVAGDQPRWFSQRS